MSAATHPWTLVHWKCGEPAFHRVSVPAPGDSVRAADYERLDGSTPQPSDAFECGSCGAAFGRNNLSRSLDPSLWRAREAA